jgi:adenylate cyclase
MAADVVGYSRLMSNDEEGTLAALTAHLTRLIEPCIAHHRGRIVKTIGDGLLAEFGSVVDAVECAIAFQEDIGRENSDTPEDRRITFRVGVNLGDVIIRDDDVYGDGVNVAARIEGLCDPGEVFVSAVVYDQVEGRLKASFEDRGSHRVKNMDKPIRVYRALRETAQTDSISGAANVEKLFDHPAVAVLPFENLSGDPEQEYFADGLTEDIITALSLWRSFPVIARNSTFTYKGRAVKVQEVAEELGARYVLEGSVRKGGNRIRVTAQLIDAETGHHVWAERYDRELEDIFQIQDEITQQIAAIIEPTIAKIEQNRIISKPPSDLAAWEFCLRGYAFIDEGTKEANTNARKMFKKAIELDPNYARAHAGLAFTYFLDRRFFGAANNEEWLALGVESARRAVALDESDSEARNMLVRSFIHSRQADAAIAEGRQAVKLNPNSAAANIVLGVALSWSAARYEEGIPWIERAIRLNPLDPRHFRFVTDLALAHLGAGNFEDAVDASEEAIRRQPGFLEAHVVRNSALGHLGRKEKARTPISKFSEVARDCVERHSMWPQVTKDYVLEGLRKAGILETGLEEGGPPPLPDKPSIAVLPFANMSGDPEQEYFVDGIVEDIITALSRVRWFGVISRNSTFAYKGQSPDIRRVARDLGVRYVLEGSIRKAGNRVRITAQLIEGASDTHLWSQRYDRELGDLFDIQDEITDAVAGQIEPELRKAELERNRRIRPASMQTWDVYQRGMSVMWRRDRPDYAEALDHFRRAAKLDPNFSAAFSAIAHACYFIVFFQQADDRDAYIDEGFKAALRAVELDGEDAFARLSLGCMHRLKDNFEECIAENEVAIQLNPLSGLAYVHHSRALCDMGRFSESLEMAEKGVSVSPNDPEVGMPMARAAEACLFLRDYEKSIEWMRKALRQPVVPRFWGRAALIAALGHAGDKAAAQPEISELLSRAPDFSLSLVRRTYPNRNPEYLEFYLDGLRKAGVPE